MSELLLRWFRPEGSVGRAAGAGAGIGWRAALPWVVPALILLVWQFISRQALVDPTLLPAPTQVLGELADMAASGKLADNLGVSAQRVLLGFLGGVSVAILLGALTGYSALWRALLDPILQALRTIPGLAWVPLFILWLGIDEGSKVALIAKAAFFPTYLNFMSGIVRADRKLIEVGQVYRLKGRLLVQRVLLPQALPFLFVGLRQSMGVAWLVVVAAELLGASSGVGYVLLDGEMTGRPHVVMACMIIFALAGKSTDWLIARIANRTLRWQDTLPQE